MMAIKISKKILQTGIIFLTIVGLTGIVLAYTNDGFPNYASGFITINNTSAPAGTNYTITIIAGTNTGFTYNGSVDDSNVLPSQRGQGAYKTNTEAYFNSNDVFMLTVPGFSQNSTASFSGSIANTVLNLSIFYPENLPPTTTFNSSSINISSSNGWYNRSVNVTLFPADNPRIVGSGVAATYYSINGAGQQTGANFIVSSQGNNSVSYYSVDNNGSVE